MRRLLLAGVLALPWALPAPSRAASRSAEIQKYRVLRANVDNAFLHQFLSKQKDSVHPPTGQIRDIGARIIKATGNAFGSGYHFYIVDESTINAMASPGGNIFIYRGILDLKLSRDETAALVAHEVSHIVRWHWLNRLRRQMDANSLSRYAAKAYGRDSAQITQLSQAIRNMQYNQAEEFEADAAGLELMVQAGFKPQAAVDLLKKVAEKVKEPEAPPGKTVITDHPSLAKRIETLQKLIDSGQAKKKAKRLF